MKHIPTPYLIYCTIPMEQYERLIDLQIKLIREALEQEKNECVNALYYSPHTISHITSRHRTYRTEEAEKMFIEELNKQGYKCTIDDAFIKWDDTWNKEKERNK